MTISDLEAEARALVDADSTSLTAATLLRRENAAYEEIVGKIIAETMGGKWIWGDSNFTALPTATSNLTAGTQNYRLTGAYSTYLNVLGVSIANSDGIYIPLKPITLNEILNVHGVDPANFNSTNGMPRFYEKREDFIVLYPAPAAANVTVTNGLKVFFQRIADKFTSAQVTTGTKEPGFPSPWHVILAYKAALPFAASYKKDRVSFIMNEINRLEKELLAFVAKRNQDDRKILKTKYSSHR